MNTKTDCEPVSITFLKAIFTSPNIPALFGGRETHDAALRTVNELLPHTQEEERISGIVESALPESYTGNTLSEIPEMVRSGVKKGIHQRNGVSQYDPGNTGPTPLGFLNDGRYVFYDQLRKILITETSTRLIQEGALLNMAPRSFWLEQFPILKGGRLPGLITKLLETV